MQGINEIRSLCSQLVLGWWDHLHTLRAVLYIPPHHFYPLARSLPLGLTLLMMVSKSCKAHRTWCLCRRSGKTSAVFYCTRLLPNLSPSHLFPIQNSPLKAQQTADLWMCMELQLLNTVPLTVPVQAKVGLGEHSSSCSSPEVALKQLFIF